jgi:ribosomal protein L11 methyltransferase
MDLKAREVLDFGTGTGVLAILAAMLGAIDVTGIDNDEWSVENALENLQRNDREAIAIHQATLDEIPEREYDVILANINRHILLQYMDGLYTRIRKGGQLLMSGLLTEDEPIMLEAAMAAGFAVDKVAHRNGWISILCNKL